MFRKFQFCPLVADALKSAEKAFIIEFILWSQKEKEESRHPAYKDFFHNGEYWVRDGIDAWCRRIPWKSKPTIERIMADLKKRGLIKTIQPKSKWGDQTLYYRVEKSKLMALIPSYRCSTTITSTASGQHQNDVLTSKKTNNPTNTHNYIGTDDHQNDASPPVNAPVPISGANAPEPRQAGLTGSQKDSGELFQEKNTKALWDYSDPLKSIYANLVKLEVCRRKFRDSEYSVFLGGLMDEYNIAVPQMITLAFEWQEYHNEKTAKPKVPKSSFRTWVRNYAERRNAQAFRSSGGGGRQADPNAGMMQHGVDYEKEMW